ncbi:hypothetical protein NC653_019316 [Populus alba x Populus x berolinensis]|uniref:Uncharacterized protein n=1 Tax=Populus alba x Populus x berolinensis TaxID=444605 RepID=A0AAD6QIN2_9ROSI|nr:hypothetical protein NC653_019316 [Populus alba x Populus x berolinensis]
MQTSVIIETDHESSVPSSKTLSLWNVSNGSEIQCLYHLLLRFGAMTYETPCFSPSLLLQNLVMVVPHPLSATEWIILYFIDSFECMISRFMSDGETNPMARLVAIISDAFLRGNAGNNNEVVEHNAGGIASEHGG